MGVPADCRRVFCRGGSCSVVEALKMRHCVDYAGLIMTCQLTMLAYTPRWNESFQPPGIDCPKKVDPDDDHRRRD